MSFKVGIPPIKSQGIKTKLVPWIRSIVPTDFDGTWIEPFMGTGAVAFNVAPKKSFAMRYKSTSNKFLFCNC